MAVMVFKNAFVSINGVDLSNHTKSVQITHSAATQDNTVMGQNTKSNISGLKEWSATVEFAQDYANSSVDQTLNALVGNNAVAVIFRPDSGNASVTNPNYMGNAIVTSYQPLGGGVGDYHKTQIQLACAGDLTRNST
jgi:hypothetical protein